MKKTTNQAEDIINVQKLITRVRDSGLTARVTNNQKLNKSTNFELEIKQPYVPHQALNQKNSIR
jgi:hypothetical protein